MGHVLSGRAAGEGGVSSRVPVLVCAAVGAVCSSVDVWLLMTLLFPTMTRLWEPSVTIQALAAAAGYALVAVLALRFPRRVNPLVLSAVSLACIVGGTLLWCFSAAPQLVGVATLAMCVKHFGCSWPRLGVGVSLCALGNKRDLVLAAIIGETVGAALRCVLPSELPVVPAIVLTGLVELVMLTAGYLGSRGFLARYMGGNAQPNMDTTNPHSFMSPSSRLVVLITFFEVIHGIALAEKGTEGALATNLFVAVVLVVGMGWVFARRMRSCEDILLVAATLLMLGGFMLRPANAVETVISNGMSFAGAALSWILIWIVFASVGMANPAGALWAVGAGYTMQAVGLEAGSVLGQLAAGGWGAVPGVETLAHLVSVLVVMAFVGYLLVGLRGFSFSEAFASIVPAVAPTLSRDPWAAVERRCRELAETQGLSDRELEVTLLLARGKTGQEIQDALTVSRNTVKTHVRHIYRKLGVHSQQELIDAVGGR